MLTDNVPIGKQITSPFLGMPNEGKYKKSLTLHNVLVTE